MRLRVQGAIFASLLLISSCSGDTQRTNGRLESFLTDSTTSSIVEITTTTAPVEDPSAVLQKLIEKSDIKFSTPVIEHSCGKFSLIHDEAEPTILKWDGNDWINADFSFATTFDPEILVDQHWVADVTLDGDPEIVLNWFYEGGNRSFGQVISANAEDCIWSYATLVDGCGDSETIDNLTYVSSESLQGSGFLNCYGGRVGFSLVWTPEIGVFVTAPLGGEKYCNGLTESFDLPLSTCSEGWAVRMAQEALIGRGARIEADGQFGPASQIAVISLQQSLNLPRTGQLDGPTWASLFPAGSEEFPDFDGDGVSSPREIGHASGAFDSYEAVSGASTPLSPRVTVVRTYCEQRQTALSSDMRGPLIEYRQITEYSNGRKKIEVVGTSWSNLSGKCY